MNSCVTNHMPQSAVAAGSREAPARVTVISAIVFLVLVAVLHFIRPDLDPSWHFLSEYGSGEYGWTMLIAFLSLAVSCAAAFLVARADIGTTRGKIGLALLLVASVSMAAGGIFVMDPTTTPPDEQTLHGRLHGLAGMIGIPAMTIAVVLVTGGLLRNERWNAAKSALRWTAHSTWISLVLLDVLLFTLLPRNGGRFGPGVWIGWPNRLLVAAWCAWLITIGLHAQKSKEEKS